MAISEPLLFIESSRSRIKFLLAPVVASFSLYGQRKLHLTNKLLQFGLAGHCSTFSWGEGVQ